jgi:Lrp/AsnC family leucine-responsive transcriptional regulator
MDEMDFRICQLLIANSRQSVREIADKLGLSLQATHKRIKALEKTDSIQRYYCAPSVKALGITTVFFWGKSNTSSTDETIQKLSKNELISNIYFAAGNMAYVLSRLRSINELDEVTDFIRTVGEIPELEMGIFPSMPIYVDTKGNDLKSPKNKLTKMDLQIINSLHYDTRKPIKDIAKELNISARTVNRRLNKMIEDDMIEMTIWFHPRDSGDMTQVLHITLYNNVNKEQVINTILKKWSPRIQTLLPFSNHPLLILAVLWIQTGQEAELIQNDIENEDFIASTQSHFIYKGDQFHTWRDKILELG